MDIDERILSHKFTRCDPPTRRQLLDVRRMLRENRCVVSKHAWLVMWIDHATRGWYKAFKQGKKGEYLVAFAYPRLKINTTDNVKAVNMRLGERRGAPRVAGGGARRGQNGLQGANHPFCRKGQPRHGRARRAVEGRGGRRALLYQGPGVSRGERH